LFSAGAEMDDNSRPERVAAAKVRRNGVMEFNFMAEEFGGTAWPVQVTIPPWL
jgi:hypothetical protein